MGISGLPGQVGIVHNLTRHPVVGALAEPGGVGGRILLHEQAGRDVVVTGGTEAVAQFELIQPAAGAFHPIFIGDGPGCGCGGEEAPLVPGSELRAAVSTEGCSEGIPVLVVVVDAAEEGKQPVVRIVIVVSLRRSAGRKEVPGHLGSVEGGKAVDHQLQGVALGDGEFFADQCGEVMVLAGYQVLEVVVQGVGVAVLGAEGLLVLVGRSILDGGVVRHIVGGEAVETVIRLAEILITTLDLEAEVVHYGPVECGVGVHGRTDPPGIIVCNGKERRSVVAVVLLFIHAFDGGDERNRGIGNRMLQTAVAGGGAGVVDAVGARAAHVDLGIADVYIHRGLLGGLEVALEVEVVAAVAGAGHDSLVVHVGVTDRPVISFSRSGDGEICAEGAAGVAEDCIHPVVPLHSLVEVDISEGAEIRSVVVLEIVAHHAEFVLELHEVLDVHGLDCVGVGYPLGAVVAVELHGNLLSLLRALGGDDNDAVCTAATVDGRRERILQHVDRRDFGGRDIVDGFHGEAVHDI